MPDEQELSREVEQDAVTALLQDMVLESADVQEFLDGLVKVASQAFTGAYGEVFCGVTLLRPRSMATVASSSVEAQRMDEIQYGFDDGPCLHAAREGCTVHIPDFLTESRFPEYREARMGLEPPRLHGARGGDAGGKGLRRLARRGHVQRVQPDGRVANPAGLDFYSDRPNTFDDKGIAVAEGFARDASRALRLAVRIAQLGDEARDRQAAMESRTVIDMAVGVIMAQNRCGQDEAIAILRRASNTRNMKLKDLCAGILTSLGQTGPVHTHFL